jgi:ABC-type multidrug transport system ATPase subunit
MLEAKSLKKAFGSVKAVDGVSFDAAKGETVGLLGPNGAGKTTTVSILSGLLRPDSGEVLIEGRPLHGDTDPLKRRIGLVPQDVALYDELPATRTSPCSAPSTVSAARLSPAPSPTRSRSPALPTAPKIKSPPSAAA